MNITYLIGNGFDLYLGMNTSPKAFLKDFVEKNSSGSGAAAAELAKHIETEGIDTWADFEMRLGNHSSHFNNTRQDIDKYLAQVESLETSLYQWLSEEDKKVTDEYLAQKAPTIFSSFANIESILSRDGVHVQDKTGSGNTLNILCFNYTSAFPRAWNTVFETGITNEARVDYTPGALILPHGSLETMLVCGVDGADQITNEHLRENIDVTTSVVKESMQRSDNFSFDIDGMELIRGSDIVCIFGMSLGQSDRRWWEHTAHMLDNDHSPLSHLVIFSHEMNGTNLVIPPIRMRAKNSVRRKFFASAEIGDYLAEQVETSIQAYPTNLILPDCK